MAGPAKETPWCTLFLVVGALTAHTLVLCGNLSTARMLHNLGASTNGWSHVGQSVAHAMHRELDPAMTNVTGYLTETIGIVTTIQKSIDVVLSTSGSTTDAALSQCNASDVEQLSQFKAGLMKSLRDVSDQLFAQISPLIDQFIRLIKPALDQIKEWLTSFGSRIQASLEEFSTTIDRVQKIFDQVMSQASVSTGTNEKVMVFNTYRLFDTDKSGVLQANDMRSVSDIYGIPALGGKKAEELFEKYDADHKGGIDVHEFRLFVNDPSIPGVMAVILRTFAKKMSDIAGRVGTSRMRDELALAVVDYFGLFCAKNMTKVGWVAQALTNRSLPIQFTTVILKNMAMMRENPNALILVDVGAIVMGEMLRMDLDYVVQCLRLMASPAFWDSEGFDGKEQPRAVARIVAYVASHPAGPAALERGLGLEGSSKESLAEAAQRMAEKKQRRYAAKHASGRAADEAALYGSPAAQVLRAELLGGVGAAARGQDQEADATVSQGQKALPATLQFAQWLANNATTLSTKFLRECFDYSGESSATLESFAKQVSGMISKVQSLMNAMSSYASEQGVDRLMNQSVMFAKHAAEDVFLVSEGYIDAQLAELECKLSVEVCHITATQKDMSLDLSGAFAFLTTTLHDLKSVLPTVITDLKFARKGVSTVSSSMGTVMQVLGLKAPPVFYQIARLYKGLWVAYFLFFGTLCLATLFYGFWAGGFCGGPQAPATGEEGYEAPRTLGERLRTCGSACVACLKGCNDTHLCFWSFLLLAEVVVLALFLISVVISIVGGLQAFISASCSQVYILGHNTICTTSLKIMRTFLRTFWQGISFSEARVMSLDDTCEKESLLTCKLISEQLVLAVKLAIIGGVLAAVLSFQMIVESAILHERSRWRRMFDAEAKRP